MRAVSWTGRDERRKAAEQLARSARRSKAVRRAIWTLAALLALGGVGWWQQDYLLERLSSYLVIRTLPYVLTTEGERELASKPGNSFRECAKDCPTMIVVPAGAFIMGSPESEDGHSDDEGPRHEVIFAKPFAVSKFEVTFEQWDACVAARRCPQVSDGGFGRGTRPVINLNWNDAQQYAIWFSRITGKSYRLLSEAEWEYVARAGTTTSYSFGDDEAALGQYAWYSENSDGQTHPVGEKKSNAFG